MADNKVVNVNGRKGAITLSPLDYGMCTESWNIIAIDESSVNEQIAVAKILIRFSVSEVLYYAEEGMTWEAWCNSEYNTLGAYVSSNYIEYSYLNEDYENIFTRIYNQDNSVYVLNTDIITEKNYTNKL